MLSMPSQSSARHRHQHALTRCRSPIGGPALSTTVTGAPLSVNDLTRRARRVIAEVAAGAAERERRRQLPYQQVR